MRREEVKAALREIDDGFGVYDEVTPTLEIVIAAARAWLEPEGEAQWCFDHKIAWSDGSDCWGAGINGIDACRIGVAHVIVDAAALQETEE
jgi:hypothetical protein